MRRYALIALCLASVFAMSPVVSEASAAPVFYTKAAIGEVAKGVPFTATLGPAFLEFASGSKMTCTAGTTAGEATGPTTTKGTVLTLTGCEISGFKCNNTESEEGKIVTNVLEGTLGGISSTLPGIRLFSESSGRGGTFAEFSCAGGTVPVKAKGSIIGSLAGASGDTVAEGKLATSLKLTYAQTKGIQKYVKFVEGESGSEQLEASVGGSRYEPWGWSLILTLQSTPASNLGFTR
jgi:hypothetical protein